MNHHFAHVGFSGTTLLAFARCCGCLSRAPGFAHPSVPKHVRVVLAAAITLAIAPTLHGDSLQRDGSAFVCMLAAEALFGAAIGMFAALVYDGAYAAGRLIDDYAGVRAIAPSLELVAPSGFGRIWSLVFTGGFFLCGAYAPVVLGLAASFHTIPPGEVTMMHASTWFTYAVRLPEILVLVALTVAGPAIAVAFGVQIVLAALARTIPRFSTFPLATACVFAAVLIVTLLSVPVLEGMAAHPLVWGMHP